MAAAIEKELGVTPEYIESGGGAFEVVADGSLVYSKKATGEFPVNGDVLAKLKAL